MKEETLARKRSNVKKKERCQISNKMKKLIASNLKNRIIEKFNKRRSRF